MRYIIFFKLVVIIIIVEVVNLCIEEVKRSLGLEGKGLKTLGKGILVL